MGVGDARRGRLEKEQKGKGVLGGDGGTGGGRECLRRWMRPDLELVVSASTYSYLGCFREAVKRAVNWIDLPTKGRERCMVELRKVPNDLTGVEILEVGPIAPNL